MIEQLFHANAFNRFLGCVKTFCKKPQLAKVTTLGCILKLKAKMYKWSKLPHAVVTWTTKVFLKNKQENKRTNQMFFICLRVCIVTSLLQFKLSVYLWRIKSYEFVKMKMWSKYPFYRTSSKQLKVRNVI